MYYNIHHHLYWYLYILFILSNTTHYHSIDGYFRGDYIFAISWDIAFIANILITTIIEKWFTRIYYEKQIKKFWSPYFWEMIYSYILWKPDHENFKSLKSVFFTFFIKNRENLDPRKQPANGTFCIWYPYFKSKDNKFICV